MNLAETARHAGLSSRQIRLWEERYGLTDFTSAELKPHTYTLRHAERLRAFKLCIEAGYRIGMLVELDADNLRAMTQDVILRNAVLPGIELLRVGKFTDFTLWLAERRGHQGSAEFIFATVSPLMSLVGVLWAEGRLSVADEHFVSMQIKKLLLNCLDAYDTPCSSAPLLIATTPEGEAHELGALCAAVLARQAGWNVLYLGPGLSVAEIAHAAGRHGARCVCLSSIFLAYRAFEKILGELQAAVPTGADIVIGGPVSQPFIAPERIILLQDLRDFSAYLSRRVA
ncbi:cobalamin-dependent protein [Rhizobium lemnae]|nr:cobalamin-dependent protein [Rhizobium lemnae]MCJ8509482.1 cobalamin-dependent protein [Rhizobium lemnae]